MVQDYVGGRGRLLLLLLLLLLLVVATDCGEPFLLKLLCLLLGDETAARCSVPPGLFCLEGLPAFFIDCLCNRSVVSVSLLFLRSSCGDGGGGFFEEFDGLEHCLDGLAVEESRSSKADETFDFDLLYSLEEEVMIPFLEEPVSHTGETEAVFAVELEIVVGESRAFHATDRLLYLFVYCLLLLALHVQLLRFFACCCIAIRIVFFDLLVDEKTHHEVGDVERIGYLIGLERVIETLAQKSLEVRRGKEDGEFRTRELHVILQRTNDELFVHCLYEPIWVRDCYLFVLLRRRRRRLVFFLVVVAFLHSILLLAYLCDCFVVK